MYYIVHHLSVYVYVCVYILFDVPQFIKVVSTQYFHHSVFIPPRRSETLQSSVPLSFSPRQARFVFPYPGEQRLVYQTASPYRWSSRSSVQSVAGSCHTILNFATRFLAGCRSPYIFLKIQVLFVCGYKRLTSRRC